MAPTDKGCLQQVYGLNTVAEMDQHYQQWAATYEQELRDNGYATPTRCAVALAQYVRDCSQPILDVGCGTGLSGIALREAGFTTIDGVDYSAAMLEYAAQKPSLYRRLDHIDLTYPLSIPPGTYADACAAGVISPGHAPPAAIRYVLDSLPIGGCLALSLNDHALEEAEFPAAISAIIKAGEADLAFDEYGEHLPGIGLQSRVYVLRRARAGGA